MAQTNNRRSLIGAQSLPVITENPDNIIPPSTPSPRTATPISHRRRSSLQPGRSSSPSSHSYPSQQKDCLPSWQQQPPHFPAGAPPVVNFSHHGDRSSRRSSTGSIALPPSNCPDERPRRSAASYPPPPNAGTPTHQRSYSSSSGSAEKGTGPDPIPLPATQEKDWFSKRGGWWRVALYVVIFVVLAVGLGVGLSIGLGKSSSSSSSDIGQGTPAPDAVVADTTTSTPTPTPVASQNQTATETTATTVPATSLSSVVRTVR